MSITTQQVLDATGIRSARTLQRWRKRNLVPPPEHQRHPNGRGMTWMWPPWTVPHIKEINKRRAAGESLDEIARTLGDDWKTVAKKWARKRPDLAHVLAESVREYCVEVFAKWASRTVYQFLREIGVERPGRIDSAVEDALSATKYTDAIFAHIHHGFNPMLLVSADSMQIVPDFLLSSKLGAIGTPGNPKFGEPVLVLPIRDAFAESFASIDRKVWNEPKYSPAMQVMERTESGKRLRPYEHEDSWTFKF